MKPIAILGLLMLLFTSCDHQEMVDEGDYAQLTFKIATSSINSRGSVSDDPYNTSQWSDAEKLIDGRCFYNLSVYLVDGNQQIVDFKNITASNASDAIVTFSDIKKGDYTLLAVANNSAQSIENKTYNSGLLESWKDTNYESLINNKIGISSDNVSSKDVIQPLSLMKNISLHAGKNYAEGELNRTFARLRIVVENNSNILPLQIKSLTFNDKFTQKQAYVFDDGTDRKYIGSLGAPLSTSSLALHPFTPNNADGFLEIAPNASSIVFDGYVLESKLTGNDEYQYILDLLYDGVVETPGEPSEPEEPAEPEGPTVQTWTEIKSHTDVTEGEYLLLNYSSNRFLTGTDNNIVTTDATTIDMTNVADIHIWKLIQNSDGTYYLQNKANGLYAQDPLANQSVKLNSTPVNFNIGTYDECISIKGSSRFIYVTFNYSYETYTYDWLVQGYLYNNSNMKFVLYRLDGGSSSSSGSGSESGSESGSGSGAGSVQGGKVTFNDPITLKTIDPVTQQATTTKEIKRNDFIDVHVTVSFNSVAGIIEYIVKDWTQVNGDITFD